MVEMPPILRGNEQQQLVALRDYLVRLARELDRAEGAVIAEAVTTAVSGAVSAERKEYTDLRGLIVKTADVVESHVEKLSATLSEDYLARSDFGAYQETLRAGFEATARGVVESYSYDTALEALTEQGQATYRAVESINGEIRRGYIEDPATHETHLGIAIAENLRFASSTQTKDGVTYYQLAGNQTFGLYTATGWQFWIDGERRGWFDSSDRMLHVTHVTIEDDLHLGAGWVMTAGGGFGLRYLGQGGV